MSRIPTVLVISDDVGFSRRLTARWQAERRVPTFTILSGDLWPRTVENFEVAIVGPLRRELLSVIIEPLHLECAAVVLRLRGWHYCQTGARPLAANVCAAAG